MASFVRLFFVIKKNEKLINFVKYLKEKKT